MGGWLEIVVTLWDDYEKFLIVFWIKIGQIYKFDPPNLFHSLESCSQEQWYTYGTMLHWFQV